MSITDDPARFTPDALLHALRDAGADVSLPKSIRCPFHDDAHPSAGIVQGDDSAWRFKCHGCGAKGDYLDIRQRIDGTPPIDTLRAAGQPAPTQTKPWPVAASPPFALARPKPVTGKAYPTQADAEQAATYGVQRQHDDTWAIAHRYTYPEGFVVLRFEPPAGGPDSGDKTFRPIHRHDAGWSMVDPPGKLPLYRRDDLPPGSADGPTPGAVLVVEGEKAADAAASIGLNVVAASHGSKAADKTDWTPLHGRDVVVWPDHDDNGQAFAQRVAELVPHACILPVPDGLAEHDDIADWIDQRDAQMADELRQSVMAMMAQAPAAGTVTPADAASPAPMLRFEPFPTDAIPGPAGAFIREAAAAIGCDESMLALPMLSMLAGAIGLSRVVQVKRSWRQGCTTWTAIIAESGSHKSPALSAVMHAMERVQSRWLTEHDTAMQQHELRMMEHKKLADDFHKGKPSAGSEPPLAPEEPVCRRVLVSDATVESLAPILRDNRRGLLLNRDELAGWIEGFDAYKASKGADVTHWLSMHDAKPLVVDRVSRGTIHVPAASVSIAGGIQPAVLARAVGQQHRDNGFLGRLLVAMPPRHPKRWTDDDVSEQTKRALADRVERLLGLELDRDADGRPTPRVLPMATEARDAWRDWYDAHAAEQHTLAGDLYAAWSKLESYTLRLALVMQLTRTPDAEALDVSAMESGIRLAEWFKHETRRVYAMLDEGEQDRDTRKLLERIERKGGSMSGRELVQATGARTYPKVADAEQALQALADAGWGRWEQPPQRGPGRPPAKRLVLHT